MGGAPSPPPPLVKEAAELAVSALAAPVLRLDDMAAKKSSSSTPASGCEDRAKNIGVKPVRLWAVPSTPLEGGVEAGDGGGRGSASMPPPLTPPENGPPLCER